jgi:ribbon-helix-helix protein
MSKRKPNSSDRLKKTQIAAYLEPEQMAALKELTARTRVPMQAYLREGLDYVLKKYSRAGAR